MSAELKQKLKEAWRRTKQIEPSSKIPTMLACFLATVACCFWIKYARSPLALIVWAAFTIGFWLADFDVWTIKDIIDKLE